MKIPAKGSVSERLMPTLHFDDEPNLQSSFSKVQAEYQDKDYQEVETDTHAASLLWAVLSSYIPNDSQTIQKSFVHRAAFDLAVTHAQVKESVPAQFSAAALSVRDRLVERWKDTELYFHQKQVKRVYYLSLEFLMGRSLTNALSNLNLDEEYTRAMRDLGIQMEELKQAENDAGLGNGGLGRLAACYLDSLATKNYPAWGYGLRYQYGMFFQMIRDGYQFEAPDFWLRNGNPWEIERLDIQWPIMFYGQLAPHPSGDPLRKVWTGGELVNAVAYDVPVPGYNTFNTINLRLWSSKPSNEFDLQFFNQGDYYKAIENKQRSETITSVLYPNDNTSAGKELRLKQQYFFVSATLHDIMKRFRETGKALEELPDMVSIQLNDTHPALGIVELLRILVDLEGVAWSEAWALCKKVFSYTNHTVLPEALEKWDVSLMSNLLPRHMELIYRINYLFMEEVGRRFPEDAIEMKRKLSLIQEQPTRKVRMAHLAIVGSHTLNGVAAIHSDLLKTHVFPEFFKMYPSMFTNVTNGVTPRRWLHQSNPSLSRLITNTLGSNDWVQDLSLLGDLRDHLDNESFLKSWSSSKLKNKERLRDWLETNMNLNVRADALFDIQIKRIHEYKRQLLNVLSIVWRYRQIKGMSDEERADTVPRVIIFGGKAAPGYYNAKLVIKLINMVADKVNNDPDLQGLLNVAFVPNYCVSLAEILIPASDLSQHISTAGMEASGTSNMKFALNGGLIIGTMDGANIEIREEIGEANMFIFGALTPEVEGWRKQVREGKVVVDEHLLETLKLVESGIFGNFPELPTLLDTFLHNNDYYLLTVDWAGYLEAQERVDAAFKDKMKWARMSVLSTAGSGKFSSDRSVTDYAEKIWNIKSLRRPGPISVNTEGLSSQLEEEGMQSTSLGRHLSSSVERNAGGLSTSINSTHDIAYERLTASTRKIVSRSAERGGLHIPQRK
eukprot:TRINITY_DN683_c0_g3_i1.p1 TRINITY_DN683_c0_g3~~TRINITY_DN683_c0_g3_i1.p1  ORF type:complete len:986 (+),score=286.41 TRINITY_DN683_c0_g3_i1:102-2960(+)